MKIARDFNANNYKIVSLTNGASANDAVNLSQLQSINAITPSGGTFAVTGSGSFSSNLSVTGQTGIGGAIASNAMLNIIGQTPYVAGQNSVSLRINNQISPDNGTSGYGIIASPIFYNLTGFTFPLAVGVNVPAMALVGGQTGTITTSTGLRSLQSTIATNNYSLLLQAAASPGTVTGGLARWEDSSGTLIGGINNYGQIYTTVASGYAALFNGGSVGIGTTAPHNTLHVQGDLFASNTVGMGNVYPTAGTVLSVSVPDQTVFPLRITQGTDPTKPVVTANAALNANGYYYINGTTANKTTLSSVFGTGFFGYTSNITVGDSTSAPVSGAHNYPAWGGVTSFRPYLLVNNVSGILVDPTDGTTVLQDFAGESEHCLYAGVIEYHNGTINTNRTGRSWVGDMTSISATSPGSGLFGWGIQMIKRYAGSPLGITSNDAGQTTRIGYAYDPSVAPNTTNTNNASAAFFATSANETMTSFGGSTLGQTYTTDIGYWAGGVSGSVASGRDAVGFNFGFLSGGHAGGYGGEFTQSLVGYGFASVEHTLAGIRLFQSTQNNYQSQTYAPLGIIVQANAGNSIFNASGGVYTAGNGYGPNNAYSYLQVGDNLPRTEYQSRNFTINGGALSSTLNAQINLATFGVASANNVAGSNDTTSLSIKAIRNATGSDWNTVALGLLFEYAPTTPTPGGSGVANLSGFWITKNGVGIGGSNDIFSSTLDVAGTLNVSGAITTSTKAVFPSIQLTTGASANYVLQSDASGNASWVSPASASGGWTSGTYGYQSPVVGGQVGQVGVVAAALQNVELNVGGTLPFVSGAGSQGIRVNSTLNPDTSQNAYGINIIYTVNASTGLTVGNAAGLMVQVTSKTGTGTIPNSYGIYSSLSTIGSTLNYGLYVDGSVGNGPGTVSQAIKLGSSQTGDMLQFLDNSSTVLANVNQYGNYAIGANSTYKRIRLYIGGTIDGVAEAGSTNSILLFATHNTNPGAASYSLRILDTVQVASGTTSTYYGLNIGAASKLGAGTYANSYGLYVTASNFATNNYAGIFMSGNVGIGTTTPAYTLDITGTLNTTGNITASSNVYINGLNKLYLYDNTNNYALSVISSGYLQTRGYYGTSLYSTGYGNTINLTGQWQSSANTTTSEISNDANTYKALMIVGNSSGDGTTRVVKVWDSLIVNGELTYTGKLHGPVAGGGSSYIVPTNNYAFDGTKRFSYVKLPAYTGVTGCTISGGSFDGQQTTIVNNSSLSSNIDFTNTSVQWGTSSQSTITPGTTRCFTWSINMNLWIPSS